MAACRAHDAENFAGDFDRKNDDCNPNGGRAGLPPQHAREVHRYEARNTQQQHCGCKSTKNSTAGTGRLHRYGWHNFCARRPGGRVAVASWESDEPVSILPVSATREAEGANKDRKQSACAAQIGRLQKRGQHKSRCQERIASRRARGSGN
ncbi:hypothetical protein BKA80DRAFT_47134 [Phyllosticta citrichinensis]